MEEYSHIGFLENPGGENWIYQKWCRSIGRRIFTYRIFGKSWRGIFKTV
jgi:hypothetical protein